VEPKGYFIGLDIGTESVGWAVTDLSYNLCKCGGKALWGVRLFGEAQSAAECRAHRTARRRLERRYQRISWLQQLFSEEIGKVDPAFFQRLQESRFLEEDKRGSHPLGRYTLFADPQYCDKEYHRQYPTIYHLRKALIENPGPFDVRLVYLAVHHIMKYRGHFLFGDLSLDSVSLDSGLQRLNGYLRQECEKELPLLDPVKFTQALTDRTYSTTQKRALLLEATGVKKDDPQLYAIAELLCGRTVSLDDLYGGPVSNGETKSVCLKDDFDAREEKLLAILGDRFELILSVKAIYDWALLEELRGGEKYISFAKVKSYEKHREDLKRLKAVIRASGDKELYREIFHAARKGLDNYPAYCGKGAASYRCKKEGDFPTYLRKKIKNLPFPEVKIILDELDRGEFLPRQTTKDNSVIPHQLHQAELEQILERAVKYLPFLNEKDGSGLTKKEQIIRMFCFRVPYYVGPLNSKSNRAWIVRTNEKIYPWNFEQVVDLERCAESFIMRMTAKCSYIGEDILPKDSLLYSRFMVLNELNNLKINGFPLSVTDKQAIYNDLFLTGRKVTRRRLEGYLKSTGRFTGGEALSGFDGDFKATLASHQKFEWLLTRPGGIEAAEEIIRHIALFGEDQKLFAGWLSKTYGTLITPEEQKKVCAMKFSGWGRLSRQFLTGIYHVDHDTGETLSIMDALWSTNHNLSQLLGSQYTFGAAVQQYRAQKLNAAGQTLEESLDDSYASPSIRRAIRQTIRIIAEIEKIMKAPPKRIFVEMAREEGEAGKRTRSRKAELTELYEQCAKEADPLFGQLSEQLEGTPEAMLRRDKLYLYYTQLGKCMYSGEPIDLSQEQDYDIEHIYPQSKIKDDSLHNRVLVKRVLNAQKSDSYPIAPDIRKKMRPFWAMLKEKHLISTEKFDRLVRGTPFTEDEQAGFIARQLVETRQSSKIVAELLSARYGRQTEIVYVKAGNVSFFRQNQRTGPDGTQRLAGRDTKGMITAQDPLFIKCREVNDFHHARDAYLNIVVGNVYHLKFTRDPRRFLEEVHYQYSLNDLFCRNVTRDGEQAWTAGPGGSIAVVRRTIAKNNILLTRMAYEAKGGLFDQNPVPKGSDLAPIKGSDPRMRPEIYGGYNKLTGAYFCVVEHTDKKKRVRSIEAVLLLYKALYEQDPEQYCHRILGLTDPKVLIRQIKINALLSFDGFRMHLSGRSGVQLLCKNANPLIISPQWQHYIKKISKYLERCQKARTDLPVTGYDGITQEENQALYQLLLDKLQANRYAVKYATAAKTIAGCRAKFQALTLADQCRILMQILNLFANTAASADLKLLCGKAGIGKLRTSKNLGNYIGHELKLIHQSVTGVFEQEINLLTTGQDQ